jgi:hypothetical protein
LRWKAVYHAFPHWQIEVPLTLNGIAYRADAANLSNARWREFVHTLTDAYIDKHLALKKTGLDVLWIFDGEAFVAERRRPIRRGGYRHLLKPKARWLQSRVGGLVHWQGQLWREWMREITHKDWDEWKSNAVMGIFDESPGAVGAWVKTDCWYPLTSPRAALLLKAFEQVAGQPRLARPRTVRKN